MTPLRVVCAFVLAGLAAMAPCRVGAESSSGAFQVLITLRSPVPVLPPLGEVPEVTPGVRPVLPVAPQRPEPVTISSGSAVAVPGGSVQGQPSGSTPPINPVPQGGICINQGLSRASGALVRVACSSGQFVGIEAIPGAGYLGVHGGAYRYSMAVPVSRAQAGEVHAIGGGTITALRVVQAGDTDGVLQMLVTF